jgi:hypothetical protein
VRALANSAALQVADIIQKMKPTTLSDTEDWKAIVKRPIEGAQMVEKFAPLTWSRGSDGHEPAKVYP